MVEKIISEMDMKIEFIARDKYWSEIQSSINQRCDAKVVFRLDLYIIHLDPKMIASK